MKPFLILLGFMVAIYASQWSFNHINAWVGIAIMVAITLFAINLLIKFFKKQNNKQ